MMEKKTKTLSRTSSLIRRLHWNFWTPLQISFQACTKVDSRPGNVVLTLLIIWIA